MATRNILASLLLGLAAGLAACTAESPSASLLASNDGSGSGDGAGSGASAAVKCELRSDRSRISVDGRNLSPAGATFSARVVSGLNTASAAARAAIGDEVEFDFDSNPNDIAAGATPIAVNFINIVSGPDVEAQILDVNGTVVASGAADCEVR